MTNSLKCSTAPMLVKKTSSNEGIAFEEFERIVSNLSTNDCHQINLKQL